MTTGLYKKGLVLAVICLFIGAGVVQSETDKIANDKNRLLISSIAPHFRVA